MSPSESRPVRPCILCGGGERRTRFVKLGRQFVECRECGLVWIDPMPSQADLDAYYAAAYEGGRYARFAEAQQIRQLISAHRLKRLRDRVRPGRWLDIGCSTGNFVAAAVAEGIEGEGIDISRAAIEIARSRGLVAHHSAVEDFEVQQPFDTITAFDVLEHLLDPHSFIRRIREWLVPGGSLALTLPDVSSLYPRVLMGRHWFYYWPDEHLFYFDPQTIRRLLAGEGFAVDWVGPAYKPLSLSYAARTLESFNTTLGGIARLVTRVLPDALAKRPFEIFVGEMMVVATRDDR